MATSDRDAVARQLRRSLLALTAVILVGTVGYFLLGFSPLDAVYQTVTTVTTIGFREVQPFGTAEKVFTILFVLVGVGVVLYTLSALLGLLIEGWAGNEWGRRRMEKQIQQLHGHTIVCGWGRVGRAAAHQLHKSGADHRRGRLGGASVSRTARTCTWTAMPPATSSCAGSASSGRRCSWPPWTPTPPACSSR